MRTRAQALLLAVFGLVVVRVAVGPDLTSFVRPSVRPIVLAAGVLVLAAAGLALLRGAATASRAAWLLLAPVAVFALIDPPPLGVLSAARPPAAPPRPDHAFARLPPRGVVTLSLSRLVLYAVWDDRGTLRGRTVRTEGFVSRTGATDFVLTRLVITCCAADAAPYDVQVRTSRTTRVPARGTWVVVTGSYAGRSATSADVPLLENGSVTATARPANPYD